MGRRGSLASDEKKIIAFLHCKYYSCREIDDANYLYKWAAINARLPRGRPRKLSIRTFLGLARKTIEGRLTECMVMETQEVYISLC